ncbi:HD family phosphohydrolase [Synoicihabitans lomoniglobus]|uniref:HDIG domain-containing protein n=1 Tax=Synoicihabitans lomoniglobus TaxID=2909285 RepID=A0AAF0I1X4_9BACT|nr:HDIG domain-containing protein [Opitutaceae bacterium LMO-M01]WED66102.1 HDIG domain-containing protein [Opitutaceae bacterium LMO-M01]
MSFLPKFKLLRGGKAPRRVRKREAPPGLVQFLEQSRVIAALIFFATVAAIVLISFVGVRSIDVPVLPNQSAPVRIVANDSFSYESAELTAIQREQIRDRIPPVYRLEFEPLTQFETHIHDLLEEFERFEQTFPADAASSPAAHEQLELITSAFNAAGPYRTTVADLRALLFLGNAAQRRTVVENALLVLREIYAQGVHDDGAMAASSRNGDVTVFQISQADEVTNQAVESMEDALTLLRINLAAEGVGRPTTLSLFRIFRNGVTPNLVYDQPATKTLQQLAIANLQAVTVEVQRGQTIIEPGTRVTPEQYEMLVAHREHVLQSGDAQIDEGLQLLGRVLLVLAMVLACTIYIRLEDIETLRSNSRLGLLALVVMLNLTAVRGSYELNSLPYFIAHSSAASLLPYIAPTALAPIIVALLIDAGSAVFMALLISIFTGVIYGNRLDLLVITFLASMVAIFCARQTRKRGSIVRATALGGVVVATFAMLIGITDRLPPISVMQQMTAGLVTGLLTGVVVVGILPMVESLFKRTTDITLLELTDYNHPLLRRMQMEAPGTYHHSLVVAQLAENAADAIGANALRARVCALFHDIGKMVKPEYFTENQREGVNPHDFNNPSLSALIIKSHVKEGVDLALQHRLPRVVVNVIRQHHGTSLIRYFFYRAMGAIKSPGASHAPFGTPPKTATPASNDPSLPGLEPVPVSETTYRYDGPRPQFKESAIILMADSCEAASRSLAKVTPQGLDDLIDKIVADQIADGQLDESPLTFAEVTRIKSSFNFTLLNMLHSRVAYPTDAGGTKPGNTAEA